VAASRCRALLHPMQVRYQAAPRPDRGAHAKQPDSELQIAKRKRVEELLVADF
jgi:hypothetical protein